MIYRIIVLLFIFFLANLFPLHSQIQKVHFSVKRNYGLPLGKSSESHWGRTKTGYGAGMNLSIFILQNFSIGFDVNYFQFGGTQNSDHLKVSKELFTYAGTINYYFLKGRFQPYVNAGLGLSNETFVYRIIDSDNYFDQLEHINVPLGQIGTGLIIPFSDHTFFIVESRYVSIFSSGSKLNIDRKPEKISFNTRYLSLFAGLCYEIGNKH